MELPVDLLITNLMPYNLTHLLFNYSSDQRPESWSMNNAAILRSIVKNREYSPMPEYFFMRERCKN